VCSGTLGNSIFGDPPFTFGTFAGALWNLPSDPGDPSDHCKVVWWHMVGELPELLRETHSSCQILPANRLLQHHTTS